MSVNKYSKAIDKIIASKKPIVEQFMDLMGLMDVTFIDTKTVNEKKSIPDYISECCHAPVIAVSGILDTDTFHFECLKCRKACNPIKRPKKQDSSVQDTTTEKSSGVKLTKSDSIQKRISTGIDMSRDGSQTKNLSVNGGTCYKCGEKNCDAVGENIHQCKTIIMDQGGSQTKRKRDATTGSTVKAHLMGKGGIQRPNKGESYSHLSNTVNAHLSDWRVNFYKEFGYLETPIDFYTNNTYANPKMKGIEHLDKLADFIQSLLSHQLQEILGEILDLVDKLHMPVGRRELEEKIKSLKQK